MSDNPSQPALGQALRAERRSRGMSLRDLSDEIGVGFNTLSRVERGQVPDVKNYQRILAWLGAPGQGLFEAADLASTPQLIARHLYTDGRLTTESAKRILKLVSEMYDQLATPRPAFAVHLRSSQTFLPEAGALLAGVLNDMHEALLKESDA